MWSQRANVCLLLVLVDTGLVIYKEPNTMWRRAWNNPRAVYTVNDSPSLLSEQTLRVPCYYHGLTGMIYTSLTRCTPQLAEYGAHNHGKTGYGVVRAKSAPHFWWVTNRLRLTFHTCNTKQQPSTHVDIVPGYLWRNPRVGMHCSTQR